MDVVHPFAFFFFLSYFEVAKYIVDSEMKFAQLHFQQPGLKLFIPEEEYGKYI